jgi:hypothetical protein
MASAASETGDGALVCDRIDTRPAAESFLFLSFFPFLFLFFVLSLPAGERGVLRRQD